MKKPESLIISTLLILTILVTASDSIYAQSGQSQQQIYRIKVYHFDNPEQEKMVDSYLSEAYIPALHRAGVQPVGVFKPVGQDTTSDRRTYVLTPHSSLKNMADLQNTLKNDEQYLEDGAAYIDASHARPLYEYFETIVLKAFSEAPHIKVPQMSAPESEKIYELRSYRSATEALNKNKVEMFNVGEVDLFARLGFNAVFYGNVVAGSDMPNLMYMTSFKDMESRDAHWKSFVDDPQWKKLSSMEKYQHNVSHIDIQLLHPTGYSDL